MNETTNDKCYRLQKYYLYLGIVCTVLITGALVGSVTAALLNIDGSFRHPNFAAMLFAVGCLPFILMSVWCILAYFRESLIISNDSITQHNVFSTKLIYLEDITHIRWKRLSVIVHSSSQKIKIYPDNYTGEEKTELIAFLHQTIPVEQQKDWEWFNNIIQEASQPPKPASLVPFIILPIFFLAFAIFFFILGRTGEGIMNLGGVAVTLYLTWLLRNNNKRISEDEINQKDKSLSN